MLSIYCRDGAIDYLTAVETRKLRPLFTCSVECIFLYQGVKWEQILAQAELTN
jgi:hypothetical protein